MNNFNSTYYIHIPKTGGRWYQRAVLGPVFNILEKEDLPIYDILSEYAYESKINTHFGWVPKINDSTFISTIVRDPVMQLCSLYAHRNFEFPEWNYYYRSRTQSEIDNNTIDQVDFNELFNTVDWEYQKNRMIKFIVKNRKIFANNQCKHLCYYKKEGFDDMVIHYPDPDRDILIQKIKRINKIFILDKYLDNITCIYEILKEMNIDIDIEKIKKYIKIEYYDKNKQYLLNKKYNNEASERLYMQLTDVDKITLNNLSPLDNLFYTLAKRRK